LDIVSYLIRIKISKIGKKLDSSGLYNSEIMHGTISDGQNVRKITIDLNNDEIQSDTIENDLKKMLPDVIKQVTENGQKLITCFHDPPNNSCLDVAFGGHHIGSESIANALASHCDSILCSFHGHIHETVDVNGGTFKQKWGSTWIIAAGNRYNQKQLRCIILDTNNPASAQRLLV